MSRQRRVDTQPELAIRRQLHSRGLRFRVNFPVPGRPRRSIDIAFTRLKIAVFVDGCYWHSCPAHATWPRENAEWWRAKLTGNSMRDRDTDQALRDAGWEVIRVWEHAVPDPGVGEIVDVVERRRAQPPGVGSAP